MGIGLSLAYVAFAMMMKSQASERFRDALSQQEGELISASPTVFNTILWRGLAETEEEFLVAYWSPFDRDGEIQFDRVKKNRGKLGELANTREVEAVKWFSCGHWSVVGHEENGAILMSDWRFSEVRSRKNGEVKLNPMFTWRIARNEKGEVTMQSERSKRSELNIKEVLARQWDRMLGDESLF